MACETPSHRGRTGSMCIGSGRTAVGPSAIVVLDGSTRGSGVLERRKELVERSAHVRCGGAPADVVLVGDGWVTVPELFARGVQRFLVGDQGANGSTQGMEGSAGEVRIKWMSTGGGPFDRVP